MTVKGLNAHSKPSIFSLDEGSFSNGSANSGSPSRDVNLNHLKIVNPAQRSPSHNQGFSPTNSPTREVPESPTQKSIVLLKEKKEDRYVIEPTIEAVKNDEFVLKSPEKEFERPVKHDVSVGLVNHVVSYLTTFFSDTRERKQRRNSQRTYCNKHSKWFAIAKIQIATGCWKAQLVATWATERTSRSRSSQRCQSEQSHQQ